MSIELWREAAERLHQSQMTGIPCVPVRDLVPEGDLTAAYAVQQINIDRRLAAGAKQIGRKIGLTSIAVQRQLGVSQPDFGALLTDMEIFDQGPIAWSRVLQPKVEAEVAFVIGRDLAGESLGLSDVIRAIEFALPSIEIVDSRIANWDISIVDTIADNASAGLFVLGAEPRKIDTFDLRLCGMVLESQGEQLSVGAGTACLGNPVNAMLWLARKMVEVGTPLRAGDVILSGALGPMAAVKPGRVYEARIEGLGSVRAVFEGAKDGE